MYYKVFEVEEGMYVDEQGKMHDIFEGHTVKVPNGMTLEECNWEEAENIEEVLDKHNLKIREDFE